MNILVHEPLRCPSASPSATDDRTIGRTINQTHALSHANKKNKKNTNLYVNVIEASAARHNNFHFQLREFLQDECINDVINKNHNLCDFKLKKKKRAIHENVVFSSHATHRLKANDANNSVVIELVLKENQFVAPIVGLQQRLAIKFLRVENCDAKHRLQFNFVFNFTHCWRARAHAASVRSFVAQRFFFQKSASSVNS